MPVETYGEQHGLVRSIARLLAISTRSATTPNGPRSSLYYGGMTLDYYPFESPGNACPAKLTRNRRVDAKDIPAAITAVDASTFDINGDSATDRFDLAEYLVETSAAQRE